MHRFLVIIEPGQRNYSAYVPDLPGCIATGKTLEEVKSNMREAINMHIQGMIEDNDPLFGQSSRIYGHSISHISGLIFSSR